MDPEWFKVRAAAMKEDPWLPTGAEQVPMLEYRVDDGQINPQEDKFWLVTTAEPTICRRMNPEKLQDLPFLRKATTYGLCHGWWSSIRSEYPQKILYALLNAGFPCNVVLIDWEFEASSDLYIPSKDHVPILGEKLGRMLVTLKTQKFIRSGDIHLVGHSLGAHVVGHAGKWYQILLSGEQFARISGLDPARPYFYADVPEGRLDSGDAEHVEIIHTSNVLGFGRGELLGTTDIFVNDFQHGKCDPLDILAHGLAWIIFLETVQNWRDHVATRADNWQQFAAGTGALEEFKVGLFFDDTGSGALFMFHPKRPPKRRLSIHSDGGPLADDGCLPTGPKLGRPMTGHVSPNEPPPVGTVVSSGSSSGVQPAVVTAIGELMLGFIDRYWCFYTLLPIKMVLQQDESHGVTKEARLRWNAIGEKCLAENIEQYRDEVDFPIPQPTYYPKDVQRANLGCRLLSWQCEYNILPALVQETSDWLVNTRIKSTLLLYYLMVNCEDKITLHVEKIFPIVYKTARDEEPEVIAHTEKAANAICHFVPLSVTWSILSSAVSMGANEGNLSVLKSVLEGTEPGILIDFVEEVLKLLGDADVVESRNKKRQAAILSICDSLLNLAPEKVAEEGLAANFFRIVITTWAQASDVEIALRGSSILENLGHVLDMDLNSVMGKFSGEILTAIANKDSEWTSVSTDKLIFDVILSQGGLAVDNNMDTLLKIMLSNLNPEKDPEVRLKFLTTLAKHLEVYCSGASVDNESLQTFVKRIIEEVMDPNLVWKAGKTVGVLRTAAVSCLLAVLGARILDASVLSGMAPKMVTSLTEVIEDASETTRVLSCECLRKLVTEAKGGLPPDVLNKLYPVILKRLDDVSNTVRLSARNVISAILTKLPSEYDLDRYHMYVEHVYTALVLHLDDSDGEIQDKVQSVLASIGHLSSNSLIAECEKTKMKHRSPLHCDALIEKFNDLRDLPKMH